MASELPDLAPVLAQLLQRVPRERQPLLIALAERMAADRYRGWARDTADAVRRAGLLECAGREEEIARRVESLHPDAAATQADIVARNPDLPELNRALFAPHPVAQQLVLQARGERLGAATWRALARQAADERTRETLLGCAVLEEANAAFLESLPPV
jgi:hypothetical protein